MRPALHLIRAILACLLFLLTAVSFRPAPCVGQQLEDVVYLKDGSVVHGTIVEQVPGQSILIQTRDGNRFRYAMDRIERITKEAAPSTSTAAVRSRKSAATAGALSALVTGAGQAYNGEWGKAALFFGGQILLAAATVDAASKDKCAIDGNCSDVATGALLLLGNAIWSIVDAAVSANRLNREAGLSVGPLRVAPSLTLTGGPSAGLMRFSGRAVGASLPSVNLQLATIDF